MKNFLSRFYWMLHSQFGMDPRKFVRSLRGLPRFFRDLRRFSASYSGCLEFMPCLHDWYDEAGVTKNEYFWQDLVVARMIHAAQPRKHVDVGSRIDGFIAHLASFREVEVFDIRPMSAQIPGVVFRQADFMSTDMHVTDYCDSLSCLHAIEHFGLGRYGDPIDPRGYERGIRNMSRMLRSGGSFYLSLPVGAERVEFNANRIFSPQTIVNAAVENGLSLRSLAVFSMRDGLKEAAISPEGLALIGCERYNLGIFTFIKI